MPRLNNPQRGFTLIELMVVVAIIGILASVAIFTFGKSSTKAKVSAEVNKMFAQFQLGEEQYNAENGTYLATGTDETDPFPSTPAGNKSANSTTGMPAEWGSLKISPETPALYCTYVAIIGDADDDANIGTFAAAFGMTKPATNWYYVVAECDMDGRGGTNSTFFASSETEGIFKQNEGR